MVLFRAQISEAQVKASEILEDSKIASNDNNKLFFVDFWATWCGPCIHAKKLLSVLQQQFSEELYIISLSEENPVRVERFLESKPTDLAVVMDYYGETFDAYNITEIPKGILFNANGKQLWKGHPSDLTPQMIKGFLRQNSNTSSFSDFIQIIDLKEDIENQYIPSKPFEVKFTNDNYGGFQVYDYTDYTKLEGSLTDILSHFSKIYSGQIQVPLHLNKNYTVYVQKDYKSGNNLAMELLRNLDFDFVLTEGRSEVLTLSITNSHLFWDTNQIDWGKNGSPFLISDADIQADNVSLKEIAYQLSNVLEMPVMLNGDEASAEALHDWQIHYKYFEFLKSNLNDYGIEVVKTETSYPLYKVIKKAP